tara:strand:- start:210 stop:536 length:327 start_codon:yes stop_codon:yes gene_type:complete
VLTVLSNLYLPRASAEPVAIKRAVKPSSDNGATQPAVRGPLIDPSGIKQPGHQLQNSAENQQVLFRQLATLDHLPHNQKTAIESYISLQQSTAELSSASNIVGVDILV